MKYKCISEPEYNNSPNKRFIIGNIYESCCGNPYYIKDECGSAMSFDETEMKLYFEQYNRQKQFLTVSAADKLILTTQNKGENKSINDTGIIQR